jgi:hypothetical protein
MSFDRSVIARSNGSLMFVCNKTSMPGGELAEGRRQKATKRSGDPVIETSDDRKKQNCLTTKDTKEHKGAQTYANWDQIAQLRANLG